jgi:hypothetical protein
MPVLTHQHCFNFLRDGVLLLDGDEQIHLALPGLQRESEEKGQECDWNEDSGWGDVQTRSGTIVRAFEGRVGDIARKLIDSNLSDYVQFTYTKPTEGPDIFNEHRDGAKDADATKIGRYKLQIGILLSDVADADGPFIYWPGSHHLALLHAGKHPDLGPVELIRTDLKFRERVTHCRFVGRAGQVILSHPLLTHGTLRNRGGCIRRMAFLRAGWREDETRGLFDRPWEDFPGLDLSVV